MLRLPIISGFSFSASGSFFCARFVGELVFCELLCARTGAARSKRLSPSHKLRRADDNLIVILLGSFRSFQSFSIGSISASLQPRDGNGRLWYRSSVSDEIAITPYPAHYLYCYAVSGRIIPREDETCSKFLINLSIDRDRRFAALQRLRHRDHRTRVR